MAAALSAAPADALARAYHRSLALRWLATVFALPVLVPLLLARGLDLSQVALVMATFAAVTAVLEVPTGGMADAFGRIRVTLIADALAIAARIGLMLAPDLGGLVAAAALGGAARALGSGSLEAWYVDARRSRDAGEDLQRPLARAGTVQSLVLALGTLAGGALPLLAPLIGLADSGDVRALSLAFAASIAVGIVSLVVTSRLSDTHVVAPAARRAARPDRVALVAVRALRRDPTIALLVLVGATIGGVIMGFETFLPAELEARWGAAGVSTVLGVVMAVAFVATALGQALAGRFPTRSVRAPLARAVHGSLVMASGATILALGPGAPLQDGAITVARVAGVALAAGGAWVTYLGVGLAGPALAAAFHSRVASGERATLLSLRSFAAYAGGVAATLALGVSAEAAGLRVVWLAVAALGITAAVTMLAWRRDPAPSAPVVADRPAHADGS